MSSRSTSIARPARAFEITPSLSDRTATVAAASGWLYRVTPSNPRTSSHRCAPTALPRRASRTAPANDPASAAVCVSAAATTTRVSPPAVTAAPRRLAEARSEAASVGAIAPRDEARSPAARVTFARARSVRLVSSSVTPSWIRTGCGRAVGTPATAPVGPPPRHPTPPARRGESPPRRRPAPELGGPFAFWFRPGA